MCSLQVSGEEGKIWLRRKWWSVVGVWSIECRCNLWQINAKTTIDEFFYIVLPFLRFFAKMFWDLSYFFWHFLDLVTVKVNSRVFQIFKIIYFISLSKSSCFLYKNSTILQQKSTCHFIDVNLWPEAIFVFVLIALKSLFSFLLWYSLVYFLVSFDLRSI